MRHYLALMAGLAGLFLLGGCGTKGQLFVPEKPAAKSPANTAPAPAPAANPSMAPRARE